ncbi:MAG: hypothetical protein CTY35_04790 [Methylotenera sp.]|uniref:hypothetical protein n=1 Tax=Methylotenera sp. TaxID=2051956 RepID=UPI000D4828FB|nr:hypothetical protein [Methylotenera sp.]PPC81899.1 MAG: hypothetical protein CTY38_07765 [Methylotenera sp.]PPC98862.1 MAG: hypothetical protein CTY35_04790 [Methylotenera sp.]
MGRKKRAEWEIFMTKAWYSAVSSDMEIDSPFKFERTFQPENIKRDADGRLYSTRAWDKYKVGKKTPSNKYVANSRIDLVGLVGERSITSEYIFYHPLWDVLKGSNYTQSFIVDCLNRLSIKCQSSYLNLINVSMEDKLNSFYFMIDKSPSIKIVEEDNYEVSLDHLAVQLLILGIPRYGHQKKYLTDASENIVKILGPLSCSPWFKSFYEEFYDWLEKNYWKDLFDLYFERTRDISSIKGWRKTRYFWNKPTFHKS